MDAFLGEIRATAFGFAPQGWMFCQGQTLSVQAYTALFSLLGTYYGGNGTTNFQLPNLAGRLSLGVGQGTGVQIPSTIGETPGSPTTAIGLSSMPLHSHAPQVNPGGLAPSSPKGNVWSVPADDQGNPYPIFGAIAPNLPLAPGVIGPAGGNQPMKVMQPTLGLNYIICFQGQFPARQ